MHKLSRQVRFSINPFLDNTDYGSNSYASKPTGQGLAMFFAIWLELTGKTDKDTGFIVNITEIDSAVVKLIVPVYEEMIKRYYLNNKHIGLSEVSQLLTVSRAIFTEYFNTVAVTDIAQQLNPARKFGIKTDNKDRQMFYFQEKFEFAAMHKLWNKKFSQQQNFNLFGKCANPAGHGHNYTAEIKIALKEDEIDSFSIADYQKAVKEKFIDIVDHKNLNADVDFFKDKNPTVENISEFAYNKLKDSFKFAQLKEITIWETQRTSCTYTRE